MGTPSTTQSKPQDRFAGHPPRPISCQWLTERPGRLTSSASGDGDGGDSPGGLIPCE